MINERNYTEGWELYTNVLQYGTMWKNINIEEGKIMKIMFNKLTSLFFAVVMLLVVMTPQHVVFADEVGKRITIVHTNDTHSRVHLDESNGSIGFEKIATLVKEAKAENPNTLLVDAGDTLHGQTFSTISKGQSIVDLMNIVGYDAMVTGNHDFNYGYERLLELKENMNFSLIAANIIKADGMTLLPPYVIKEVDGIKIAIFGLATPETAYKTSPNNITGLTFEDPSIIAQKMVDELKDKADIIIALAHLGLDESSTYRSDLVAKNVIGIDLIIDGHSHTMLEEGKVVNGTLIAQTGEHDKNLGYVDLYIEDGNVTSKKARLVKYEDTLQVKADEQVEALFASVKEENDKITAIVVGNTPVKLDGERENARMKQTNLGSVIADAMIYETGADVAITNGGGLRASIDQGEITKGQVITVLPFGNYVKMIEVKGSTLLDAMERGVSSYPELDGGFPQVGGMTYKFDGSQPPNERIIEILIGDKKLDKEKTYKLATNDFMSMGGDNYTMFADAPLLGEFSGLDEVAIDYFVVIGENIPSEERGIVGSAIPQHEEYIVKVNDVLWKIAKQFQLTYQVLVDHNNIKNPNLIFPGQKLLIPFQ